MRVERVVACVFMAFDYCNSGYFRTPVRISIGIRGPDPITRIDGSEFGARFDRAFRTLSAQVSVFGQKEGEPISGLNGLGFDAQLAQAPFDIDVIDAWRAWLDNGNRFHSMFVMIFTRISC